MHRSTAVVVGFRPALRHLTTTELYILCWRDSTQPFDTCLPHAPLKRSSGGIPPGPSTPDNHMHRSTVVVVGFHPALRHLSTTCTAQPQYWWDSTQPFDTCQPHAPLNRSSGGIPPSPSTPDNHMHRSTAVVVGFHPALRHLSTICTAQP